MFNKVKGFAKVTSDQVTCLVSELISYEEAKMIAKDNLNGKLLYLRGSKKYREPAFAYFDYLLSTIYKESKVELNDQSPNKLLFMIESENFPVIGKVVTPCGDELVFEIDNYKKVLFRNVTKLERSNKYKDRQYVSNFINRTVFYTGDFKSTIMLDFNSEDGRACQKYLEEYFGKKDKSAIKFIESLENAHSDIEKFEYCIKIIYQEEVDIPKSRLDSNTKYYLVIGMFCDLVLDDPITKIFLQKVEKYVEFKTRISHEELSINLFHCSQLFRVRKFFEKVSPKG